MAELNYTKGEWNAKEITTEQGRRMAGGYKYGLWADTNTPASSRAESIAFIKRQEDANLIAAAPDTYQELKEADSEICRLCKMCMEATMDCISCEDRERRLKALAKAEGR